VWVPRYQLAQLAGTGAPEGTTFYLPNRFRNLRFSTSNDTTAALILHQLYVQKVWTVLSGATPANATETVVTTIRGEVEGSNLAIRSLQTTVAGDVVTDILLYEAWEDDKT